MTRLKVFIKANLDAYYSLHSCRVGGGVAWNGVNQVVRETHPGMLFRVAHETATQFAAMAAADGQVPESVAGRDHLLGDYPVASQFSTALFRSGADVIVLSTLADIASSLHRHRAAGYLFHPPDVGAWPAEDREWVRREFMRLERPSPAAAMADLERIVSRIREVSEAPILVYNVSSVVPGEWIHNFEGLTDLFSIRVREFNLALTQLSARTGISIVDVDRIVACAGADHVKQDVYHLTPEGHALVAREFVRILEDLGVIAPPAP